MRTLVRSEAFDVFYFSMDERVREKIDYVLMVMSEIKIVNSKFVKRLEGTEFYEMRISVDNEYRVILFSIDDESFISATTVLLLNGFVKKSTKDYKPQIRLAKQILDSYSR